MPNRTAKFASAIVVSLLAGAPLATLAQGTPQGAPPAADDCLSGPKNTAPAGSHWRYHIDRATKRHCWYLHDERAARAQPVNSAASANASAASNAVAPDAQTPMQGSVANAHAELRSPRAAAGPNANSTVAPWPAPTIPATADSHGAMTPDANAQRSQIASRWPGQSDAASSADPDANDTTATQPSTASVAPAAATVPLAAADVPPAKQSGSIQTLLIVITGALALAGLVGAAVVRFGRGRRDPQRDRREIWDSAMTNLASRPGFPSAGAPMPRLGIPHELRTADDPDQRIAHMLARLARSARA